MTTTLPIDDIFTEMNSKLRLLLEDQVRRSGETNQVLGEGGGEGCREEGSKGRG